MYRSTVGQPSGSERTQVYREGNTIFISVQDKQKREGLYVLRRMWYAKPGYQPVLYKLRQAIEENPEYSSSRTPGTCSCDGTFTAGNTRARQPLFPAVIPGSAARYDSTTGTGHNRPSGHTTGKVATELACDSQLHFGSPVVGDLSDNYWILCDGFRNFFTLYCKKGTIKNPGDCHHRNHHRASGNCPQFLLDGYLSRTGDPSPDKIGEIDTATRRYFFFL
jgi:hypothetical protein